jgi:hypothetical protein
MAIANNNIIYVIDTNSKLLLQTIKTNEGKITILTFIKNTKYLISGTKNGRVMQYRYDGRSAISRLCSFGHNLRTKGRIQNNYVSAFAQMNDKIACSGYGGIITVLTLNSYHMRHHIEASKVKITALLFLNKHTLISANVDGVVQIHSLKKYQQAKRIITPLQNIKSITLLSNKNFILVNGDSPNLILINISSAKIAHLNYVSFKEDVSYIELLHPSTLMVITSLREVHKVELPIADDLKTALFNQELDKVYNIIDRDPTLQGSREHKRAEVMYERLFSKAVSALVESNSNEREAHKILKMFENIESKKSEISAMFRAFKHYPRFKNFYLEKNYHIAYVIAERHPTLKRTSQFKKMEEIFKEAFSFAQKQVLRGREDLAKEILSPYAAVNSKKPMISLILAQNREFINFLKALENKNYNTLDILAKEESLFQEIPTYLALQKSLQQDILQIDQYIFSLEIEKAQELMNTYLGVSSLENQLLVLQEKLQAVKLLQNAYERSDFISCYEILDIHPDISELELAQLLEKHWSKILTQCEEFAMIGDFKSIKKTFGELLEVKTRVHRIGDLLRLSFFTQIKALLAKRNFKKAEAIIYSYNDIFGLDREMRAIMKTYETLTKKQLAITDLQEQNIARDEWRNSPKIMS